MFVRVITLVAALVCIGNHPSFSQSVNVPVGKTGAGIEVGTFSSQGVPLFAVEASLSIEGRVDLAVGGLISADDTESANSLGVTLAVYPFKTGPFETGPIVALVAGFTHSTMVGWKAEEFGGGGVRLSVNVALSTRVQFQPMVGYRRVIDSNESRANNYGECGLSCVVALSSGTSISISFMASGVENIGVGSAGGSIGLCIW